MGLDIAKSGRLLYHLTRFDNLDSIIQYGLLPRSNIMNQDIPFSDIANTDIITKRTQHGLDSYIPFHFHPYSAFDVAVKHTYCNFDMIYLCYTREKAKSNGFMILPKHPLSTENITLYTYDEGMNQIDWDAMTTTNQNDDYTKQVKMAECLSSRPIPITDFSCIYVPSAQVQKKVYDLFIKRGISTPPPHVNVQEIWFVTQ